MDVEVVGVGAGEARGKGRICPRHTQLPKFLRRMTAPNCELRHGRPRNHGSSSRCDDEWSRRNHGQTALFHKVKRMGGFEAWMGMMRLWPREV